MSFSLRVAIADHDPGTRMSLKAMLYKLGHEVVAIAENGTSLVKKCAVTEPDVVITGPLSPEMNGRDAAEAVYRNRAVPIIFSARTNAIQSWWSMQSTNTCGCIWLSRLFRSIYKLCIPSAAATLQTKPLMTTSPAPPPSLVLNSSTTTPCIATHPAAIPTAARIEVAPTSSGQRITLSGNLVWTLISNNLGALSIDFDGI